VQKKHDSTRASALFPILMRLSAGLSRLSVSITSGGAVIPAIAAGSAVDASALVAKRIVGAGSVNQRGCDC
jgi:hypothetical protein